jgi:uncharacterized membrane protein YphA (DoxX/SURF4 family)
MIASLVFLTAGLLVWGGQQKLVRPDGTVRSLSVSGLIVPRPRTVVRLLGAVEVGVGAACLLGLGAVPPATLAALYLGFTVYLVSLLVRRVPAASCGCFGRGDVAPSLLHVFVNVVAAGAGLLAAFDPPPPVWSLLPDLPLMGIAFAAGVVAAGYLVVLAETHLPALFFSYRRSAAP